MTLKIYKLDASPRVQAVLMTAEILKLNYETQDVDLMSGEQMKPEYLEKNPTHTVPWLEDDDFVLADSHAIVTYLVSKYGADQQATLYPSDLKLRATIDQRLYFEASNLSTAARDISFGLIGGQTAATPKQIENLKEAYGILDKYLQKTKYVACNHLTVADVSLVAAISSANVLVPVEDKYTNVHRWWNMLKKEDWYKKTNVAALAQYEVFIKSMLK